MLGGVFYVYLYNISDTGIRKKKRWRKCYCRNTNDVCQYDRFGSLDILESVICSIW